MSKAYDKVMAGLGDARGYLKGERDGFAVHEIEVPEPDVVAIRGKTGLSQPAFAKSIGVPLGTLKNWEQKRRRPEGSARVLLALIEKAPVAGSGRTRSLSRTLSVGLPGRLKSSHTRFQYAQRLREPGVVFGLPASEGEGFLHEQEARGEDDAGRPRPHRRGEVRSDGP